MSVTRRVAARPSSVRDRGRGRNMATLSQPRACGRFRARRFPLFDRRAAGVRAGAAARPRDGGGRRLHAPACEPDGHRGEPAQYGERGWCGLRLGRLQPAGGGHTGRRRPAEQHRARPRILRACSWRHGAARASLTHDILVAGATSCRKFSFPNGKVRSLVSTRLGTFAAA